MSGEFDDNLVEIDPEDGQGGGTIKLIITAIIACALGLILGFGMTNESSEEQSQREAELLSLPNETNLLDGLLRVLSNAAPGFRPGGLGDDALALVIADGLDADPGGFGGFSDTHCISSFAAVSGPSRSAECAVLVLEPGRGAPADRGQ